MLSIALPSGKSLEAGTLKLFDDALISVERKDSSAHSVRFLNYQDLNEGKFLKPRRIPILVERGECDVGITGLDAVHESGANVEICARLSFGRNSSGETRIVIFANDKDTAKSIQDIPTWSVVLSEYPRITNSYFINNGVKNIRVEESPGSCEAEVPNPYRFGVCLTETGRSLRVNNLKEITTLFTSHTVLIANKKSLKDKNKSEAIHALKLILVGAIEADNYKLITMNAPIASLEKIVAILPAMNAPTIAPLVGTTPFVSVSSAVEKDKVSGLVTQLLKLGAEGLLITPMSSIIKKW